MISVILPTYNEAGHIERLLRAIGLEAARVGDYEAIVVDDDSPDGTADQVAAIARTNPRIRLERRTSERGLASAIWRGIELARGDVVLVMDADFNHAPEEIPKFCALLAHFDIVAGSRFTMRGGMRSRTRYVGSFLFNVVLRLLLRTQVQDNLSGFFASRTELLRRIEPSSVFFGYGDYFMRLLILAWRAHLSIIEVPVFYGERPTGISKTTITGTLPLYVGAMLRLRLGLDRPRLRSARS